MMKKIFISYRRSDSYNTDRIAESLENEFGKENVFFDVESIRAGTEWSMSIKSQLLKSDLMLLIIGPNWLHMQDEKSGRRRIDMEGDWVRMEIITFLQRKESDPKLVLIPVLVNGATMPEEKYLDVLLSPICACQFIELNKVSKSALKELNGLLTSYNFVSINPSPVETPNRLRAPDRLSEELEKKFLDQYPEWSVRQRDKPGMSADYIRELYRFYEFQSYDDAWRFICKVDEHGIREFNHHPRWQNTYNRVEFWLCTFNIGHKPSERDIKLAEFLEKTYLEFK